MTQVEITEMQTAFQSFKEANEKALSETQKFGKQLGESTEKLEKHHQRFDELEAKINARAIKDEIESQLKLALDGLKEVEAKLNRKSVDSPDAKKEAAEAKREVFFKALRSGYTPDGIRSAGILEPEQLKTLIAGDGAAGGYLAPLEFVEQMITSIVEYSPIRGIASVRSTTRQGIQMPKRTGTASASWVEEIGSRPETTNPAFGMVEIRPNEMYAMTKVSRQELEDSVFNLEQFLRGEFAEQFGVAEGLAFVSGNGVGKPFGFMSDTNIGEVNSGEAAAITADGLIALYYELKEPYLPNAYWVLSRSTLKSIRQLKHADGTYIWMPGIATDSRPSTILDRPYVTAIDMPSIGAGLYPVAFGDFRRGYQVVDRVVMEVMVDPYKSKEQGMVEFSARKRVGGQVVLAEAIKKLKISA